MSEIYGYANAVSAGNSADETLNAIRRQINAQNSLSRDNFSKLRMDEKQNKIIAQANLANTKLKDRESEGLEGAGIVTALNDISKRKGDMEKLGNKLSGYMKQASAINPDLRPTSEGGAGDELANSAQSRLSQFAEDAVQSARRGFFTKIEKPSVTSPQGAGPEPVRVGKEDEVRAGEDTGFTDPEDSGQILTNLSQGNQPENFGENATRVIERGADKGVELPTLSEGISTGGLPVSGPARFIPLSEQQAGLREGLTGINRGGALDPEEAESAERLALRPTDIARSRFLDIDPNQIPAGFFSRVERPTQPKESEISPAEAVEGTDPSEASAMLRGLLPAEKEDEIRGIEPVGSDLAPSLSRNVASTNLINNISGVEAPIGASPSPAGLARESLRESLKAGAGPTPTFASRQIAQGALPEGTKASILGGGAELADEPAEDVAEKATEGLGAGQIVGGLLKGATIATGGYDAIKDIADPKSFKKLDKLGKVSNIAGIVTGGLETAGLAADATGIGAVVGVPLQALGLISGGIGLATGLVDDIIGEKKKKSAVQQLPTIPTTAQAPQQAKPAFQSAFQGGQLVQ